MSDEIAIPPHDDMAEAALLASCMWDAHPELSRRYAAELAEDDFYRTTHRLVFRTMRSLVHDADPVHVITVNSRLAKLGLLDEVGGTAGLMKLWDVTPMAVYHEAYARTIRELRTRRDLMAIGGDLSRSASARAGETDTLIAAVESRMTQLTGRLTENRPVLTSAEASESVLSVMKAVAEGADYPSIPTPIASLNTAIVGLEGEGLSFLAARPSMGKSAFLLQLLIAAAGRGFPGLWFAVETGVHEAVRRAISVLSGIPVQRLRARLSAKEVERAEDAAVRFSALPISIDGTPQIDIGELRRKALAWAGRMCPDRTRPGLIGVDYLQLCRAAGFSAEKRHFELGTITRTMKAIARETGCHVLCLSQLSRRVEARTDKRPILSDLRESGSIEEDADLVLFLYRDSYYTRESDDSAEILIGKQRNGPALTVHATWDAQRMTFSGLHDDTGQWGHERAMPDGYQ